MHAETRDIPAILRMMALAPVSVDLSALSPEMLLRWIRDRVQYVRDGIRDRIQHPAHTLQRGAGDCEDMAILACALVPRATSSIRIYGINSVPAHAAARINGVSVDPANFLVRQERKGYNTIRDVRIR
jgi:hypothetical protein